MFILFSGKVWAQENFKKMTQPIIEEGILLFRSEKASWLASDMVMPAIQKKETIGAYVSYSSPTKSTCVFFSKDAQPNVLASVIFDTNFSMRTAIMSLNPRKPTPLESELLALRNKTIDQLSRDTLFKAYQRTNLNLIPLIRGKDKKVFIITAPTEPGMVFFGNDYVVHFDASGNWLSNTVIHRNLIPVSYGQPGKDGQPVLSSVHNHLPESGDFITSTDICTLLLYSDFAGWQSHSVFSSKYMSLWNQAGRSLLIIPLGKTEDQK